MDIIEHRAEVAGIETFWRQAGDAPILYVHGNPNNSDLWVPFLERTGGVAMDLPGFGRSAKPAHFDYSIDGLRRLARRVPAPPRLGPLPHARARLGRRRPARSRAHARRLVIVDAVPFLPGYRWHRFARIWRTPLLGELFQGSTTKWGLKRFLPGMPDDFIDSIWDHYDHGTQRAILKLYRSAPPDGRSRARANGSARSTRPALVVWGADDQYLPTRFAHAYGEALGGETSRWSKARATGRGSTSPSSSSGCAAS